MCGDGEMAFWVVRKHRTREDRRPACSTTCRSELNTGYFGPPPRAPRRRRRAWREAYAARASVLHRFQSPRLGHRRRNHSTDQMPLRPHRPRPQRQCRLSRRPCHHRQQLQAPNPLVPPLLQAALQAHSTGYPSLGNGPESPISIPDAMAEMMSSPDATAP